MNFSNWLPQSNQAWLYLAIIVVLLLLVFFFNKGLMKAKSIIDSYIDESRSSKAFETNLKQALSVNNNVYIAKFNSFDDYDIFGDSPIEFGDSDD